MLKILKINQQLRILVKYDFEHSILTLSKEILSIGWFVHRSEEILVLLLLNCLKPQSNFSPE